MVPHEHFEELSALAATGDLREDEYTEIDEHLQSCADCRAVARDFEDVSLILAEAAASDSAETLPEGMTERFIARARTAGVPLSVESHRGRGARRLWFGHLTRNMAFGAAVAIIFLVGTSFFVGMRYGSRGRVSVRKELSTTNLTPSVLSVENERLKGQLRTAQEQETIVSLRLKNEQQASESAQREKAALMRHLGELEEANTTLHGQGLQWNAELAQLKKDLDRVHAEESANRAAYLATEADLTNLRNKNAKLSAELGQTQELNTALNEARDLIIDRNVHVLNVFPEVDENGHPQRARGRIFYAEGKKLVFYAYDLTDPRRIIAKASFFVWGETPGTAQRVVSLGKFQLDSERDGRWVLRVTDPRLLAQINSVFVTLEPDKTAITQPTGKRMLSRLLDTTANHQ